MEKSSPQINIDENNYSAKSFFVFNNMVGTRLKEYFPIPIIFILILGAILRVLCFFEFKNTLFYKYPILDALYYDELAMKIASGNLIQNEAFFMGPLYPYLLGSIYFIFGHSLIIPRIFQMLLGLMTSYLAFILGRKIYGFNIIGYIAAFLITTYKPLIFFEQTLLMEVLVSFMILLSIYTLLLAAEKKCKPYFILAGIVLGLTVLTRGNLLLTAFPIAVWIFVCMKDKISSRQAIISSIIFILSVFIGILPATLHNYIAEKDFVLITSNAGINLYIGNNEKSDGEFVVTDELDFFSDMSGREPVKIALKKNEVKSSEVSKYWNEKAKIFIKENPKKFISLLINKIRLFWGRDEVPQLYNQRLMSKDVFILRAPLISFAIIGPLTILAIFLTLLKPSRYSIVVLIFILTYMFSILPFFITDRYRICIIPAMILSASFALYTIVQFIKSSLYKKFFASIIFLVCLSFIFNNYKEQIPEKEEAQYANILGNLYMKDGKYKDAETMLKKSLDLQYSASSLGNLGVLYFKHLGNNLLGYDYMKKALRLMPGQPRLNFNMAMVCVNLGKYDEAINHLNLVEKESEIGGELYYNLAILYSKKGEWILAAQNMEKHLKAHPADNEAFDLLLKYYKESIQFSKGEQLLTEHLEKHPEDSKNIFNLGVFLHLQGKRREALIKYKEALRLNPNMSAAQKAIDLEER